MEGNSMIPGGSSYGGLDLQGYHLHRPQNPNHPSMIQSPNCNVFPLSMGQNQLNPMAEIDFNNMARAKTPASEKDEPESFIEETPDAQIEPRKEENPSLWHRVKWTDSMVKLLITAVSYIDEDVTSHSGPLGRKRLMNLQKKGKWKTISKVMAERGFCVSPQQCEDKFNDLNKRYKKLNDILGRGTSCQVVENPVLLDMMGHLPDKVKDEVRKILSSKHLFYEEMCSYHNLNRLHLPHDPALQRSLHSALSSRDDADNDTDDDDDHHHHDDGVTSVHDGNFKRTKHGHEFDVMNVSTQRKWMKTRLVEIEKKKMTLEMEMSELENQRLKWKKISSKKDWKLEKMKMENEKMKMENEQMAMELRLTEMRMEM